MKSIILAVALAVVAFAAVVPAAVVLDLLLVGPALAQWSLDPAENLVVGGGPGDQTVPHAVTMPVGGDFAGFTYVGFYNNASGNYDVGLQMLSPDGIPMWAEGGIIVSAHAQDSWVMDWGLAADAAGNALLTFVDIRDGNNNVHVYKISPNGEFLWGPDGIALTADSDFKGAPCITVTGGDDVVVVWIQESATAGVRMQRLNAGGDLLLPAGGIVVSDPEDTMPFGTALVPSGGGDIILGYVPVSSFTSYRQIKAQRFDPSASPVWDEAVWVMDDATVPMGSAFKLESDGDGGAVFAWSVAVGMDFGARVQRLGHDGSEHFAHNGAAVHVSGATGQIDPDAAYNPLTGETTVVYTQMNSNQSQKGLSAQRFDAAGNRLWGAAGTVLRPQDQTLETWADILWVGDTLMGMCLEATPSWATDRVVAFGLGNAGELIWDDELVVVASTPSAKTDLMVMATDDNMAVGIWADQMNGSDDILAQNLFRDGSFDGDTLSNDEEGETTEQLPHPHLFQLRANYPNPFNPVTTIGFALPRSSQISLRIHDARGRLVKTLVEGYLAADEHSIVWHGDDDRGMPVPSGAYYYTLQDESTEVTRKMMLLK